MTGRNTQRRPTDLMLNLLIDVHLGRVCEKTVMDLNSSVWKTRVYVGEYKAEKAEHKRLVRLEANGWIKPATHAKPYEVTDQGREVLAHYWPQWEERNAQRAQQAQ